MLRFHSSSVNALAALDLLPFPCFFSQTFPCLVKLSVVDNAYGIFTFFKTFLASFFCFRNSLSRKLTKTLQTSVSERESRFVRIPYEFFMGSILRLISYVIETSCKYDNSHHEISGEKQFCNQTTRKWSIFTRRPKFSMVYILKDHNHVVTKFSRRKDKLEPHLSRKF